MLRRLLLFVLALVLLPANARADEGDDEFERAHRRRFYALDFNPFGLIVGHYSPEVQFISAGGHALVVNPYVQYVNPDYDVVPDGRPRSGYGLELAYRFYTGERGPNGLFGGAGVIVAREHLAADGPEPEQTHPELGFLVDGGAQAVFDSGFLVGGGVGLQALKFLDNPDKPKFGTRVLFSLGYAF